MYFAMVSDSPAGFVTGVIPYHWTQVVNVKRDPFETSIGQQEKTLMGVGGALAGAVTAYQYDWNLLPMGQALWLKELESYLPFPPLQNPASYNLDQVVQQVRDMKTASHAGEQPASSTVTTKRTPARRPPPCSVGDAPHRAGVSQHP